MSSLERANSSNKLPAKGFDSDLWEELAEWSAEAFRAALVAKASQGVKFKFYVLRGHQNACARLAMLLHQSLDAVALPNGI